MESEFQKLFQNAIDTHGYLGSDFIDSLKDYVASSPFNEHSEIKQMITTNKEASACNRIGNVNDYISSQNSNRIRDFVKTISPVFGLDENTQQTLLWLIGMDSCNVEFEDGKWNQSICDAKPKDKYLKIKYKSHFILNVPAFQMRLNQEEAFDNRLVKKITNNDASALDILERFMPCSVRGFWSIVQKSLGIEILGVRYYMEGADLMAKVKIGGKVKMTKSNR